MNEQERLDAQAQADLAIKRAAEQWWDRPSSRETYVNTMVRDGRYRAAHEWRPTSTTGPLDERGEAPVIVDGWIDTGE